jgi:hypothetical protein
MQRQGIFHYISIIYPSEPIKHSPGRRRPDFARINDVIWYMAAPSKAAVQTVTASPPASPERPPATIS